MVSEETENGFLGLVVHELRSPITVIVGLAATLSTRRRDLTEEQIDDSLTRIEAQGGQLARLVDDLLDLAQVEAGRFRVVLRPVQLAGAARRSLEDAPPPAGHEVELVLPDDLWVAADPLRLEQVLVNLLTNAYRYGGRHIRLEATQTAAGVLATVSDDGAGVPEELVSSLFERFARGTVDGHGAGLGLAIVRALMEAFGGSAWYEAGQPVGARFGVLLARVDEGLDNLPAAAEQPEWDERVRKILVVDDESNMRFLLRMVLESEGFAVVEARHGAAALELVKEEAPDLIVTDLMMPVMNGRELVQRLRADTETAAIPILVVSSNRNTDVDGADGFLRKPFDIDALLETARSLSRKDEGK